MFINSILIVLLTLIIPWGNTEANILIEIASGTITAEPGESIFINVSISNAQHVNGYDIKLGYNQKILLTKAEPHVWVFDGGFLSEGSGGGTTVGIKTYIGSGYIRIKDNLKSSLTANGDGTLFKILFLVKEPGRSNLDLFQTKLYDADRNQLSHTSIDGLFYTNTPRASFKISYSEMDLRKPIVGESIAFDASDSYDPSPDGTIISYKWDFGDGTTKTYIKGVNLTTVTSHIYSIPKKDYIITLTVTDNEGKTNTAYTLLNVVLYDIAITRLKVIPAAAEPATIININVTVTNYGTEKVYFNLTLYYDDNLIWYNKTEGKSAFSLLLEENFSPLEPQGGSLTVTYQWNTTSIPETTYTIKANASILYMDRYDLFWEGVEDETNNHAQTKVAITSFPINIAVVNIDVSSTVIPVGEGPLTIKVTVENQGRLEEGEIFSVAVYYGSVLIENRTDVHLGPNSRRTLEFVWDTTSLEASRYIITANVSVVPNEMIFEDNTLTYERYIIISHPPKAFFDYLPTKPEVFSSITFDASASQDLDGTIIKYSWDFGDGVKKRGKTVTHIYTSTGAYLVTLNVTDNATLTSSLTLKIIVEKATVFISLSVSTTTISYGDSVILNGTVTPPRYQANVTLQLRVQGEPTWSNLTTTMTNATSQFEYLWVPHAAGTYEIRAAWFGDANNAPAQSTILTLTVNKATSTISIILSKEKVTLGSNITISGAISPPRADATVIIQIKTSDETWETLATITTDSNGQYAYIWIISEPGTYYIVAAWEGDSNTLGSQSLVRAVTVEEEMLQKIPLHLVAGVTSIGVAAATFLLLRLRKSWKYK